MFVVAYRNFFDFYIELKKRKRLNLTIVAKGKVKNCKYLGNVQSWSETEQNLGVGGGYTMWVGYL